MHFFETDLPGVWRIELERHGDERGYFARSWCEREFTARGLVHHFVQASTAFTHVAGTVRGLHFQRAPHWETKLVRCTRGSAWVVAADVRPQSPTHCQWLGLELTEDNGRSLYVPDGYVQGYQTLCNDTELLYQMSTPYHPEVAAGYRYDDPAFSIDWPLPARNVSERDLTWASYS